MHLNLADVLANIPEDHQYAVFTFVNYFDQTKKCWLAAYGAV